MGRFLGTCRHFALGVCRCRQIDARLTRPARFSVPPPHPEALNPSPARGEGLPAGVQVGRPWPPMVPRQLLEGCRDSDIIVSARLHVEAVAVAGHARILELCARLPHEYGCRDIPGACPVSAPSSTSAPPRGPPPRWDSRRRHCAVDR